MKVFLGLAMAVALTVPGVSPAHAAVTSLSGPVAGTPLVLVEGGCGRDYHRVPDGRCVPNWREWEPGWRACPPGWHLGREGRRCWPN